MSSLKKKLGNVIVGGLTTVKRAILNVQDDKDKNGNPVKKYNIFADGEGL